MSQRTTRLTPMLAALALASLPVFLNAQSTQHPKPGTSPQHPKPAASGQHRTTDHNSPQHHLQEAHRVLNAINVKVLKGETGTQVAEIRQHFTQLQSAWRAQRSAPSREASAPPGHATGHVEGTSGTTARTAGSSDWMTHYSAIDRILDRMLGANASVSGSATTATTGSVSAGVKASTDVKVDASTRTALMSFRKHLDAFHATAMTAAPSQGSAGVDIPEPRGATGAASARTQAAGTTGISPGPTVSIDASGAADSATIARLTAAIDDLLRADASPSTDSVCVDRAALGQLRRDIEALEGVR